MTRLYIEIWLLRAAFLALPLLICLSRHAIRRFLGGISRPLGWALLGLMALSFAARWFGGLWSINHENAIGFIIFEDAAALDHFPSYGLGGHVWYNTLFAVLPTAPATVIASNFVLGSLTPLLVFAVAWGLFRESVSALLAATLLAANPCHVRLSASESLHVPLLFFGLLGLAALLVALHRERERTPFFLAAIALAIAAQVRPLGALFAAPVLLVLLTRQGGPGRWLRRWEPWAALGVGALLSSLHVYELLVRMTSGNGELAFFRVDPGTILGRLAVPSQHAFVDPAVTPVALQLLVVLGIVALALFDRRSLLVVLPSWLLHTYFNTTHGENPVDHLRFHMDTLPWAVLLAGASGILVSRAFSERRGQLVAVGLLIAAALTGLVLQRGVLTARYDQQREYAFLSDAIDELPDGATLVHLDRFTAGRELTTELPRSWFRARGKLAQSLPASVAGGPEDDNRLDPGGRPTVWYRGVTCWTFVPHQDFERGPGARLLVPSPAASPGPLRPLCREMEARWEMEVIAERTFRAQPDRFVVPAPEITIGFYRVTGPRGRPARGPAAGPR